MDFKDLLANIANVLTSVKIVIELCSEENRQIAFAKLQNFADSEAGQKTSDWLTVLASFGIFIIGFVQAVLVILIKNSSVEGLYAGMGVFIGFALFGLWIFSLRGRK